MEPGVLAVPLDCALHLADPAVTDGPTRFAGFLRFARRGRAVPVIRRGKSVGNSGCPGR